MLWTQMWSFKTQRETQVLQARDLPGRGRLLQEHPLPILVEHYLPDTELAGLADLGLEPVLLLCGSRLHSLWKGPLLHPKQGSQSRLSAVRVPEPFVLSSQMLFVSLRDPGFYGFLPSLYSFLFVYP